MHAGKRQGHAVVGTQAPEVVLMLSPRRVGLRMQALPTGLWGRVLLAG